MFPAIGLSSYPANMGAIMKNLKNPNYQGPFGNTLLHGAAISGDVEEASRLLAAGADPKLENRYGLTPVAIALKLGHARLGELFARYSGVT